MAKRNRTKDVNDGVEEGRLRLALLKENSEYRRFFDEHKPALYSCLAMKEDKSANKCQQTECMTTIGMFVADCETKFGMAPHAHPLFVRLYFPDPKGGMEATPRRLSLDQAMMFLDPATDVESIPRELSLVFDEMFFREGIYMVVPDNVPPIPLGEARREIGMPKKIQPYQRLLLIDLRENPTLLKERFAEFLDRIYWSRKVSRPEWRDSYVGWVPDRSRERKEAWQHLKVWRMRRHRKSFSEIARTLSTTSKKMAIDAAKKSFYRAFELIEERSYSPEEFRRDYWEIRKAELKRTCATCPDRNNCTVLCPDVLSFIEQDTRKHTLGRTVGGTADVLPRDGRKRAYPTMDQQEKRKRSR